MVFIVLYFVLVFCRVQGFIRLRELCYETTVIEGKYRFCLLLRLNVHLIRMLKITDYARVSASFFCMVDLNQWLFCFVAAGRASA